MNDESRIDPEDRALFLDAVGPVDPIEDERVEPERPRVSARPRPEADFDQMVDAFGVSDLADAPEQGEQVQYVRPGVQKAILRKLKRGGYSVSASLDLHGLTVEQARQEVGDFIRSERGQMRRCVRIVHGKGYRSADGQPVLKTRLNRWLPQRDDVVAFCSAPPHDGGTGALYVLLRRLSPGD
ncbi:DNA mismatch repair protein MutS [Guyparkeria halophila]|uniref:DNA mismatch repair protein MutS n=1 Tax=Guyparkeria halophila TaxID=47960 RepID=A0A6I6DBL6_9GAMM|nr:Smr/MutS family protein [Guyparkeria halophila]QGT79102.1 DNA mismatch repair protein MutS [Guyparkeria halophila]